MTQLSNAVILITGANGGFGQEFTRQLLQIGSRLILTDIDEEKLSSQANTIKQEITTGEIIACLGEDLSNVQGCNNLYQRVKALNVRVDILVNNAGISLFGRIDEVPVDEWEKLMQVNLLAPMRLTTLFIKDMIDRQQGHIVNISSLAGWVATAGMAHYDTSKFGLRGFSEALYQEVKPYNLKVTAVYPFFSRTPIIKSKGYGTLAENYDGFPENLATNPQDIIHYTIKGIFKNKLSVFPDKQALIIHLLKRYFPQLLNLLIQFSSNFFQKS
jgi:short-subunit dehydrogenase